MTKELKWEKVTEDTERLKVPGGWLYRMNWMIGTTGSGWLVAYNVVFVPEASK